MENYHVWQVYKYTSQCARISTHHSLHRFDHDGMSHSCITSPLLNLSVELIYRILDQLEPKDLFLSVRNVCQQLDAITDTYHPYHVSLTPNLFSGFEHPLSMRYIYAALPPSCSLSVDRSQRHHTNRKMERMKVATTSHLCAFVNSTDIMHRCFNWNSFRSSMIPHFILLNDETVRGMWIEYTSCTDLKSLYSH